MLLFLGLEKKVQRTIESSTTAKEDITGIVISTNSINSHQYTIPSSTLWVKKQGKEKNYYTLYEHALLLNILFYAIIGNPRTEAAAAKGATTATNSTIDQRGGKIEAYSGSAAKQAGSQGTLFS